MIYQWLSHCQSVNNDPQSLSLGNSKLSSYDQFYYTILKYNTRCLLELNHKGFEEVKIPSYPNYSKTLCCLGY